MTVRGDDFTACWSDEDLAWLSARFEEKFEVKIQILGPGAKHAREVRILNRVVRWTESGIDYEPDQRHAEMVVRDLGLQLAKAVTSPGTKEDQSLGSAPEHGLHDAARWQRAKTMDHPAGGNRVGAADRLREAAAWVAGGLLSAVRCASSRTSSAPPKQPSMA